MNGKWSNVFGKQNKTNPYFTIKEIIFSDLFRQKCKLKL